MSGATAMAGIERAWRDQGPVLECRFSVKMEGQGVSCYSHGWHGVYHDLTWKTDPKTGYRHEEHCPVYGIAAWLFRRADYYAARLTDTGDTGEVGS